MQDQALVKSSEGVTTEHLWKVNVKMVAVVRFESLTLRVMVRSYTAQSDFDSYGKIIHSTVTGALETSS